MKLKSIALILISLFVASCQGVLNPEAKVLKTESKWLSPSPDIPPISDSKKIVFVSLRNSSGGDIDLSSVKQKLKYLGYTLTGELSEANMVLLADLRYLGVKSEKGYGGLATGALVGAIGGGIVGSQTGNTEIGAVGGGLLGAGLGALLDSHNQIKTLDLVVDISIGERVEGGIKTNVGSNNNNRLSNATKVNNGSGTNSGSSNNTSSSSSAFVRKSDFFYHKARLVCSATKISLTEQEAIPALEARLSRSLSQVLP